MRLDTSDIVVAEGWTARPSKSVPGTWELSLVKSAPTLPMNREVLQEWIQEDVELCRLCAIL